MAPSLRRATRVIVISDLHLGGEGLRMMSQPDRLAAFIGDLAARPIANEDLELVIAGDFVDFLAIEPFSAWTPDPIQARMKLESTMHGFFAPVFNALAQFLPRGHRLTLIIGNHDVEMAMPPVQDAILERLLASPHQVHFVDDGRAYRVGRALIEHGNRYDGANLNDWTGLRAIASALSRAEPPNTELEISAGSRIVEGVVNKLRARYPFINLLEPSGELLAYLLISFEPSLTWHLDKLRRLFKAGLKVLNDRGQQPAKTQYVAFLPSDEFDSELDRAFGDTYAQLRSRDEPVGVLADWAPLLVQRDSLSEILDRGESIPADRLQQIRLVMRRLLLDDRSARPDGDTGQYGKAADRLLEGAHGRIETVVMGHTHQARHIGSERKARYINTGTWADVVRVRSSSS